MDKFLGVAPVVMTQSEVHRLYPSVEVLHPVEARLGQGRGLQEVRQPLQQRPHQVQGVDVVATALLKHRLPQIRTDQSMDNQSPGVGGFPDDLPDLLRRPDFSDAAHLHILGELGQRGAGDPLRRCARAVGDGEDDVGMR